MTSTEPSLLGNFADDSVVVIVPVRNDAKRLRVLLESLRQQTRAHALVVVDNGSSDESRSVAASFGAKVLDGSGLKVGALRNLGVANSQSVWVAFCDSDHEVPVDWLQTGLDALKHYPGKTVIGSHYLAPKESTWVQSAWAIHRLRAMGRGAEETEWLGAGNMMLRREDFDSIGGFSENLVAAEDVDLCHRLRGAGGRVICDPAVRSFHHGEPKTLAIFLRKEYWRGSSGLKAWLKSGCPMSDIPSFIWPLWHLLVPLFAVLFAALVWWKGGAGAVWLVTGLLLWFAPAFALAIKNARQHGVLSVIQLAVLYFLYGLARAAALFKGW